MITLVLGRRELGKTTLAAFLARRSDQAIVFDPRCLFQVDDLVEDLPDDEAVLWSRLVDEPKDRWIVVQPQDDLEGSAVYLANLVRAWCSETMTGTLAIVLDESSLISLRSWDWVCRCAPRDRVHLILTSHRPQDVDTRVRALADQWCLFRMTQQHDLDAVRDRCGDLIVAEVRRLAPRTFVLWDDARGQMLLYRDPQQWFVGGIGRSSQRESTAIPGGETTARSATLLDRAEELLDRAEETDE